MSRQDWQSYCLNDAKILKQHRFGFDEPLNSLVQKLYSKLETILRNTPLREQNFLHLLEDVFHMLWQQQYGSCVPLPWQASIRRQGIILSVFLKDVPVAASYF